MIFNCPACSAGHSVPVSMIPNGGMELTCRRCSDTFTVDIDDSTEGERAETGPEATTVGVANPYDELVGGASLITPGGEIFNADAESDDDTEALVGDERTANHDRPTIPISTLGHVPLGPDELGVDPELDNTQRVDVEEEDNPTFEPSVQDIETPPPRHIVASRTNNRPPIEEDSGLYAKVAAGSYTPPPPVEASSSAPRSRAWNEPSSIVAVRSGGSSGLRKLAEALNGAPLALKVALIVFPVSLGVTLVLTAAGRSVDAPVEIETGVASVDSTRVTEEDTPAEATKRTETKPAPTEVGASAKEAPAAPPTKRERAPQADGRPALPKTFDAAAPEGFSFVQAGGARLRIVASPRGRIVGRVEAGQLVRRIEVQSDFVLVIADDVGPVGFVESRWLGDQKPIEALATDLAFSSCTSEGRTVDTCLFEAKTQEGQCLELCGSPSATDPRSLRCREACGVAFDRCTRACNPTKSRRRRTRRRF